MEKMEAGFVSQTSEIRDVRHRVGSLESWKELRHAMDERQRLEFAELKMAFAEAEHKTENALNAFRKDFGPIVEYVSNQKSLDTYRKWLFGAGIAIAGLLAALVTNPGG